MIPQSLIAKETMRSQKAHNDSDWDPDNLEYTFTTWLKCVACNQEVAVSGLGGIEPSYGPQGETIWEDYFTPKLVFPTPDMFPLPRKCPEAVSEKLRASFAVYWMDQAAAASRIRIAVERLMDHLGVKKRKKTHAGRMYDLSLHERIEEFASRDVKVGGQLMALKWLGNTGSHEGSVTKNDLLDAFEIMEHTLVEVLERRSDKVAQLAKQLTKRHHKRRGKKHS